MLTQRAPNKTLPVVQVTINDIAFAFSLPPLQLTCVLTLQPVARLIYVIISAGAITEETACVYSFVTTSG